MTTPVSRKTVEAFFQAFASKDPSRLAPFLDDDVTWSISGPVELIRYCGERRGKAAVIDYRAIIDSFDAAEQFLGHAIDLSQAVDGLTPPRLGVVVV